MNERAESFLSLIRHQQRGRLKIYLGYAAGVGKSYQMLLEAHRLAESGVDTVIGIIETHGRSATEALCTGLECLPKKQYIYNGITIEEMDVGAIIKRKPEVVIIDELAHSNVPGSRNAKRWQDVEEVIGSGIHVIAAMNIQHMESLYETIERATGVKVTERIPDKVIAGADQLVNIDITTEDLRNRLAEGRIYPQERIDTALTNFFTSQNLGQLRELALRELASQIDSRHREYPSEDIATNPDQVMVCLSSAGPNSEALLRYASRIAGKLNRNWYAVYVQTERENPLLIDAKIHRLLSGTLELARQLGATVFTYKGDDVVKTILQFAKEYRVGHIVIGSPGKKLPLVQRIAGKVSIIERLITESEGVSIVVVDTKITKKTSYSKTQPVEPPTSAVIQKSGGLAVPDYLETMTVLWQRKRITYEQAVSRLTESVFGPGEQQKKTMNLLQEWEAKGSTIINEDIALPHAKIESLKEPIVGLFICESGIVYKGSTVRFIWLLLSPSEPPETHINTLSIICALARDLKWREAVIAAGSADKVKKINISFYCDLQYKRVT